MQSRRGSAARRGPAVATLIQLFFGCATVVAQIFILPWLGGHIAIDSI